MASFFYPFLWCECSCPGCAFTDTCASTHEKNVLLVRKIKQTCHPSGVMISFELRLFICHPSGVASETCSWRESSCADRAFGETCACYLKYISLSLFPTTLPISCIANSGYPSLRTISLYSFTEFSFTETNNPPLV